MKLVKEQILIGERALFNSKDLQVSYSTFDDGESPLKESQNINIDHSIFKWKYPLWYCKNIVVEDSTFLEMARSGIWYTENITIRNTIIEAPKIFRRAKGIKLENVTMQNAGETFWNCDEIFLKNVTAKGDYFGMNSTNIKIDGFQLAGNYAFDGGKNIEIHNAKILAKDAFWNCENVTVYDSFVSGEYLGWNSKNVTFVNCTIESLQGLCYMDNLVMKDCQLLNTTLSFEYSTVDVQINSTIGSVTNPSGGIIRAEGIGELIMDKTKIDPEKTQIITKK
ncbi:DUF3737 family protein [Clostridium estertheticum]|uniref:DUF3737 family protein n=1 Tax=Clostridium estertheticum TaxID=238834 RepID=UPI001CF4944E|nr:DUF3737 family protein [Clostridium estertheticum]MCB2354613.1 DUF3737 family protein [Clostridium estertheticum]MCB2358538.1 DUF3737 family protein [Clostridium estertheticum]WAG40861.1 DUF3737 family protein [Clostridium estertheticum]